MDKATGGRLRVLVVDDESAVREVLRRTVERLGCEAMAAEDAVSAIALLRQERFHAVITDKNMPGTDHPGEGGLDVIAFAKAVNPGCAVLMVTGFATVESAIEAMQLGAFDYVSKPILSEELKVKLDRVKQYQQTIDPAGTISAYSVFRDKFLAILDQEAAGTLDTEVKAHLLAVVQREIDRIFHERRKWEQLILEQREALTRVAAWVEELMEHLPSAEGRVEELLAAISSEVNRRV